MPKLNLKLISIFIGIISFFPTSFAYGQGFDRGKFILYGTGSLGLGNNSGSIEKSVENTNFPNYLALNSPYTDNLTIFSNFYALNEIVKDRTELSSRLGELGFEYGLFRYFGIGFSVSNQIIKASHFRAIDERQIIIYSLTALDNTTLLSRLNQGDFYDFAVQKRRDVLNSTSGDLSLFFHFLPNDPFDPYIRVGGGTGFERLFGGTTNRVFGALGVRYHINDLFFINAEIEHANVYMVKYEAPNSGHRNKGNYEESFFKFGLGLSFTLHGQTNPEIESKPANVLESVGSEVPPQQIKEPVVETKLERFVFLASEIFDLPSSRIHLEGRARLDAISRSLENEYKDYDVQVITYTTPFKEDVPGNYDNYDLGFERSQAISRVLREKGVNSRRIIDSTQGSAMYNVDSKEKVVIELRKKNK